MHDCVYTMGNTKSVRVQKDQDSFFGREKRKELKLQEKKKKNLNPANKRIGVRAAPVPSTITLTQSHHQPSPLVNVPASTHAHTYDAEALERMRYQLNNDANAFLMNNILLSIQFFENYEREIQQIKNNPISEIEHRVDEAMVPHHKHVFFADRIQECVQEHVTYQRHRGHLEPLAAQRLFVIYDNVEASEPGDTSDYSAVLDAPFYKLLIEDCKEPGYVKLKKLEILESKTNKESEIGDSSSEDSEYTDSEKESNDSDDCIYGSKGEALLQKLKTKLNNTESNNTYNKNEIKLNSMVPYMGRRGSGPVKQMSLQATKSNINNIDAIRKTIPKYLDEITLAEDEAKPKKSILKTVKRLSGPTKDGKNKLQNSDTVSSLENPADDTETSGYRSNSSSRQTEFSETESDYGYSTITQSTTPKRVQMSSQPNIFLSSGVLSEECWNAVQVQVIDNWSDDDDDMNDSASKISTMKNLYETYFYLNSINFMANFVDNFVMKLGLGLGLNQDAINNSLTQGASIYCDSAKNGIKGSYEVFPALLAAWPNAANTWIIRERRLILNPRTNFTYQWPTKYMVNKAIGYGCLLVPIGFRPKRGLNPDLKLQWKVIFPAAERYLENNLAHSHMRCYLFMLAIHKTFLENETSKIGIDTSHIKNHLFWQCEDNYAKWPEDRLGESLRLFLKSFYANFGQNRFANYFIDGCNEFKGIPKPLLLKLQRKLKDILEAPVMHLLNAIDKLKYTKKEFYPALNCQKLYAILTSKTPLRIINPAIPILQESSDSEDEPNAQSSFWDRAKAHDRQYLWKKERQRQIMQERKKSLTHNGKKHKLHSKQEIEIKTTILPTKMESERRRLVLEFFIPHFIAMARASEKFEAISQSIIYLEQAQRLSILLLEEPAGDEAAHDYLDVIRDKLADCQRKLIDQSGYKLPHRRDSNMDRITNLPPRRKQRPTYENIVGKNSPTDLPGISAFTFADVHTEQHKKEFTKLTDSVSFNEESKL